MFAVGQWITTIIFLCSYRGEKKTKTTTKQTNTNKQTKNKILKENPKYNLRDTHATVL